jgi:hypothetical protein
MKKGISIKGFSYDKGLRLNKHTVLQVEVNEYGGMTAFRQGSSVGMAVKKSDVILFEDTNLLTHDDAKIALALLFNGDYPNEKYVMGYYPKKNAFVGFYGTSQSFEVEDFKYEGEAVAYAMGLNEVHTI